MLIELLQKLILVYF